MTKRYRTEIRIPRQEVKILGNLTKGMAKGGIMTALGIGSLTARAIKRASKKGGKTSASSQGSWSPVSGQLSVAANIKGMSCVEIVTKAVEKAARDHNGFLKQTYTDCRGREHPSLITLAVPGFERGIGATVSRSGNLSFAYDPSGADEKQIEAVCNAICRNYAVIAVMRAQRERGYNLSVEEGPADKTNQVRVTAVRS